MSQPDLINGLYEEKPRSSIYTAMLGIALVSLIIAAYLLYLEMEVYQFDFKAAEAKKVAVPLKAEYPEAAAPETTTEEVPPEGDPAATPSATPSATADPTATATPSATATPAATPSATAAPAGTAIPAGTAPVPAASGTTPVVPAPSATAAPSATGT